LIAEFRIKLEDLIAVEIVAVSTSKHHKKSKLILNIVYVLFYIFLSKLSSFPKKMNKKTTTF